MFKCNQLFSILFLPKKVFIFLLRCVTIFRFFYQKQLFVAIKHISVIFAFERVDFSLIIPHQYQQLGFGCRLIASLSLTSSSHRRLIVGFLKNYSSPYRWLKQLLVIVIVSSSVAFFDFETIWSAKSFPKVSAFQKFFLEKEYRGEPTRKES